RHILDARVRRSVHRAERGRAGLDAAVHLSFDPETGEVVVVIEAIVVPDDRRVDGAGHWPRPGARVATLAIVDDEFPRLAELERAVAVEGGADRLRIDIGDAERGLRIQACPLRARGTDRRLAPRHVEGGAN